MEKSAEDVKDIAEEERRKEDNPDTMDRPGDASEATAIDEHKGKPMRGYGRGVEDKD